MAMPSRDEFVTLYDGESGKVLFEDVALDCIDDLSSPGPKDDVVGDWLRDATQVASDAELRAYIKRAGATVPRDVQGVREVALWIAACEHAESSDGDDDDDDVDYGDSDDDE